MSDDMSDDTYVRYGLNSNGEPLDLLFYMGLTDVIKAMYENDEFHSLSSRYTDKCYIDMFTDYEKIYLFTLNNIIDCMDENDKKTREALGNVLYIEDHDKDFSLHNSVVKKILEKDEVIIFIDNGYYYYYEKIKYQ